MMSLLGYKVSFGTVSISLFSQNGWMNGWMDELMDEWMDKWMNG